MPPGDYVRTDVHVAETPNVPGKLVQVDDVDPKAGNPDTRSEPRKKMDKVFEDDLATLEKTKPKLHKAARFFQSVVGRGVVSGSVLAVSSIPGLGPVVPFLQAVTGVAVGASAGEMFAVNQLEQNSLKDINQVCGNILTTKFQELWERNRQREIVNGGYLPGGYLDPAEQEIYNGILNLVRQSMVNERAYDAEESETALNNVVDPIIQNIHEGRDTIDSYLKKIVYAHNSTSQVKGWRPAVPGGPAGAPPGATAEAPNDIVASFIEMSFHVAEPGQRKDLIDTLHKSYANLTNIASEQGLRIDQATAAAEANALLHKRNTYFGRNLERFRHKFRNLPWWARAGAGLGVAGLGVLAFSTGAVAGTVAAIGLNAAYGAISGRELVSTGATAYKHSAAVDGIRRGFLSVAQRTEYEHDLKTFFKDDAYGKSALEHHRSRAKEVLKRRRIGFGATGAIASIVGQWFHFSKQFNTDHSPLPDSSAGGHVIAASHEITPTPEVHSANLHLHNAEQMATNGAESGQALYNEGPGASKSLAEQVVQGWAGRQKDVVLTDEQHQAMVDTLSEDWQARGIFTSDGSLSEDIDFTELREQINGLEEAEKAFEVVGAHDAGSVDVIDHVASGEEVTSLPGIEVGDDVSDSAPDVTSASESFSSATNSAIGHLDSGSIDAYLKDPEIDRLITEATRADVATDTTLQRKEVTDTLRTFTNELRERLIAIKNESSGDVATFRNKLDSFTDSLITSIEKSSLAELSKTETDILRKDMLEVGNKEIHDSSFHGSDKVFSSVVKVFGAFEDATINPAVDDNKSKAVRVISKLLATVYRSAMK